MTREDFIHLERAAAALPWFGRVGVFSPLREFERKIWPKATRLKRWRWDLNRPGRRNYDLLVAANVFMYSPDPAAWFRHVLSSCRYFLIVDLIRRRRGSGGEYGNDGDQARFEVHGERPRVDRFFRLEDLGDRVLASHVYEGGANEHDTDAKHFIALLRGDLAEPFIRIDDYPTGIRPILDDLTPVEDVIRAFEERGLRYHLGIIPTLLTDPMKGFLRSLEHMVPVVHGYDHCYPTYSVQLEAAGDPYNQRTVGTFDEFDGVDQATIADRLGRGRALLEETLTRDVTLYIPPCNRGNRATGRALVEAGYTSYLSEKKIPGCELPWRRSDFYGRSPAYRIDRRPEVVTLHTTWEWDVRRDGDLLSLPRLLDDLEARRDAARAEIAPAVSAIKAM